MFVFILDPEFVSSAFIEQSADGNPTGDDDKIYFFFTEVAKEYDLYTKVKVPRVARVCKVTKGRVFVIMSYEFGRALLFDILITF